MTSTHTTAVIRVQNEDYSRITAASLVRGPHTLPHGYFSNKQAHHPVECAGQKRLTFQDLLELRVMTLLIHTCRMSRSAVLSLSNAQAEKLTNPYPLSDLRNLSEMKDDPQTTDRLLPKSDDEFARAPFQDAVTALIDSLDFHVNTPVRWNTGHDMNIARPGASVMIDPAVKAGVPIIMDTDVTTRSAAERVTAYPNEEQRNAQRLTVTVTQLQVASLYESILTLPRPLGHMPAGRWHFGIPGDPKNAARLVDQLLARLAADEDPEEAEQDQPDRTPQLRTA